MVITNQEKEDLKDKINELVSDKKIWNVLFSGKSRISQTVILHVKADSQDEARDKAEDILDLRSTKILTAPSPSSKNSLLSLTPKQLNKLFDEGFVKTKTF